MQKPLLTTVLMIQLISPKSDCHLVLQLWQPWGRFHEKSQFETSFGLSLGLKSETFVSAEFLAQIDFTKGDSAETGLKS